MQNPKPLMLKISRPLHLLLAALTYALGASLADYLAVSFVAGSFWFGLVVVLLVQLSMSLLPEIFRLDVEPLEENETRAGRQMLRNNILYVSIASLAFVVLILYSLFTVRQLPLLSIFFIGLSLGIVVLYAIPPFRLANRGFGEILLAIQLAYIFPSLAFVLQAGDVHRFLVLTIPLTLLAFGYFVVRNFVSFAQDQKYDRVTFLTRIGWERAVPLHHLFVLTAYILFLTLSSFGFSLSLIWPAFLTLPFALYQIFQLRNISLGLPPNWTILTATALTVFGLTTYFIAFTFWTR
jgi:1,4-dihydroxy-2-naphthoate octaprenyltransferase